MFPLKNLSRKELEKWDHAIREINITVTIWCYFQTTHKASAVP